MKIKPKIEFEHLQHKEYEVIAVNSSAMEFYLVQNDKRRFEWYESRFFDKQTIIDQENLFREELNEYHYYLVPEFLNSSNRKFNESIFWSLQGSEFYNQVLFLNKMEANGYELCEIDKMLVHNQDYQFSIIKEQINSLGKTLTLLSDGYFPSLVSIQQIDANNQVNDEPNIFKTSFENPDVNLYFSNEKSTNLNEELNEIFEWSYNWVKGFNICQKIFEDSYWNNQLLGMIHESIKNIYIYSKLNNLQNELYHFKQGDGSEVKFLKMNSNETKTILKIQNVVH
jgi:hypothetical protein